ALTRYLVALALSSLLPSGLTTDCETHCRNLVLREGVSLANGGRPGIAVLPRRLRDDAETLARRDGDSALEFVSEGRAPAPAFRRRRKRSGWVLPEAFSPRGQDAETEKPATNAADYRSFCGATPKSFPT